MSYSIFDFLGTIGVVLILVMYLALHTEKITSNSTRYSLLNGLGALCILISLCFKFNLSAFVIEFFWLIISIYGISRHWSKRTDKAGTLDNGRKTDS